MRTLPFHDRLAVGRELARHLLHLRGAPALLVLALPRGGEVTRALGTPLDVLTVRKIGHPHDPEYAVGAVASGGFRVMAKDAREVPDEALEAGVQAELKELAGREQRYRGTRAPLALQERTVIVVDDGLATGATLLAAAQAVRAQAPQRLVLAVPVGTREGCDTLRTCADEVVCPHLPNPFRAVGAWYQAFPQVSDEEVLRLLAAVPCASEGIVPEPTAARTFE